MSTDSSYISDILRSVGVTGIDAINHLYLYLFSRYLTFHKTMIFKIPVKFAWENIYKNATIDLLYHPKNDCLMNYVILLFDIDKFTFCINKPIKHKEILDILNNITDLNIIENFIINNWSHDYDQFFTQKYVCDYMISLCNPGFMSKGVPESICDLNIGYGSFISSFIRYYNTHYTDKPIDWSIQHKEIHGFDLFNSSFARLNLCIDSDTIINSVINRNCLYEDLPQLGYDIIITKIPAGIKGIEYIKCCDRIKSLNIKGIHSESLYMQLIMVSLNRKGRCAIIVPEKILINKTSMFIETRKYLLNNFELQRVIKMNGKLLKRFGLSYYILFFVNTGKPTSTIEFCDTSDDLTESAPTIISSDKFDNYYSLDIRHYVEIEKPAITADSSYPIESLYPIAKIGDILTDHISRYPIASSSADGGPYHLYSSYGLVQNHSVAEFKDDEYLIQPIRGTISANLLYYSNQPFSVTNQVIVLSATNKDAILIKYVYYYLKLTNVVSILAQARALRELTKTLFRNIKIPIPPITIQQEIVNNLDNIYATSANINNLITSLHSQIIDLFIVSIKSSKHSCVDISSFCSFEKSIIVSPKDGEFPFITLKSGLTHNNSTLDDSEHVFISNVLNDNKVLQLSYYKGACAFSNLMFHCKLNTSIIIPKFFYNYFKYNMDILNKFISSSPGKFNTDEFLSSKFIIPSLYAQNIINYHIDIIEKSIINNQQLLIETDTKANFILDSYLKEH